MKRTTCNLIEGGILLALIAIATTCSRSNNLLEGRVQAQVGDHVVVVTDCYRTSVPSSERLDNTPDGQPTYRFAPCRDAVVELRGAELVVNGTSYGGVKPGDAITVDHGRVLINDRAATATATPAKSNTPTSVSPPN
jgi:hypothetical protein